MFKVYLMIAISSFYVSTPLGPIFLNLIFPLRWSTMEFIGMFHDLLAIGSIQFNYGGDILLCGSKTRGKISLLVVRSVLCKSNMLLHLL
jgi:hypothetical protein